MQNICIDAGYKKKFSSVIIMVCRYLTQQLPAQPTTLPVTVTLSVPSKKFTAASIIVQPDERWVSDMRMDLVTWAL